LAFWLKFNQASIFTGSVSGWMMLGNKPLFSDASVLRNNGEMVAKVMDTRRVLGRVAPGVLSL